MPSTGTKKSSAARRTRWYRATVLVTAAVFAASLSGCGNATDGKDEQARELLPPAVVDTSDGLRIDGELIADKALYEAAKSDTVILYSGTGKEAEDLMTARFRQETGIEVELTRLPTNKLAERVLSEHGAGQLSAEVIRLTDPLVGREMARRGVFAPYRTPFHDLLRQQGADIRDTYWSSYYFVNAMGYNSAIIDENPPTRWEDLADPRFKGDLGIVAITTGGTLVALTNFQIENLGVEFLEGQARNNPRIYDSTSTEVDSLARGEISVASLSFNNAFAAKLAGAPLELVIPDKGVSASEAVFGLTAAGAVSPAAQVYANWSMSKAGQRFAGAQGFVPTRTDVGPVKAGDYELPQADDPRFHLLTEAEFDRYAARNEEVWKTTFGYMG
ncbi:ABC transporter substrate-binding protein [Nocardia otitidiscaviarum]|uniref:ABC transporter substrate-binding protein n=1 Tax=Nocardia otitidiscaviarum TaxID=1823 RepID=UPI0018930394|nr:extracellular solute-binding protein [Nocardia otitidiscaviarum]MBF6180808.1 extracellular solute-binding protein [Nocardia otitidiscaviarum]